jgi:hypothetical protein
MWTFKFSSYKSWQFITTVSIACKEYSTLLFSYYAIMAKILKNEGFATL